MLLFAICSCSYFRLPSFSTKLVLFREDDTLPLKFVTYNLFSCCHEQTTTHSQEKERKKKKKDKSADLTGLIEING